MPFEWKDYYSLSKFLIDTPGEFKEASYRTAVSRAYYYSFHYVTEYAKNKCNYTSPQRNQHSELRKFLNKNIPRRGVRASGLLSTLHNWRNQCDYKDEVDNLEKNIYESLIKVEQIKTLLGS